MLARKLKLKVGQWRTMWKEAADRAVIVAKFLCFLHITENYICSTTLVHGPSMLPTLNVRGDVLLSDRVSHRLGKVGVGDVVLVKSPENPRKTITKRIVAMEGDRVSLFGDPMRSDFSSTFVMDGGCVMKTKAMVKGLVKFPKNIQIA
ncbi:hypothetical protein Dimus_018745 [Dionaea muscipula]